MGKSLIIEGVADTLTWHKLLNRASLFGSCCFLDNLSYQSSLHAHDVLLGAGVLSRYDFAAGDFPAGADEFIASNRGRWIFGHLSYELHEALHGIAASKPDRVGFPLMTLFVPQICFRAGADGVEMVVQDDTLDPDVLLREFTMEQQPAQPSPRSRALNPRLSRQEYVATVKKLQDHSLRGDCYEINFCQEFFAGNVLLDPVQVYQALVQQSPNPFSCYYRQGDAHLMCASPERYLARRGDKIISQPIKGTAPRHANDPQADAAAREALRLDPKEQSENVMVVDLVRNDLSRVCAQGSVQVDELFGIYSYPQVHQMISTISGTVRADVSFTELLKATFPMGSMTGAPKMRVMELIEQYEPSRRGLFSGSVGYVAPNGDFDFNVVIRSILYNSQSRYLSYFVGSGITWYAAAEQEYEECLWKAAAIRTVLEGG